MKGKSMKRKSWNFRKAENFFGYIFLSPWLFGLFFFGLFPLAFSFLLCFLDWDLMTLPKFVGVENFKWLMGDHYFIRALINTFYYASFVPISVFVSLVIAVMMNRNRKIYDILRVIYFLPSIVPAAANAVVWVWLLHPDCGIVNYVLWELFHIKGPNWSDPSWTIPSFVIMSAWGSIGYNVVLFTAGLKSIDRTIYEAAMIDGATPKEMFFKITLPLISPTTFFVTVTSFIWSFQVFDISYMSTNGRPNDHSITIVYYIYQNAFQYFKIGKAAVIAWMLAAIIFIITYVQFKLEKRLVFYQ